MIPAGRPLRVAMLDPNANTPPYDRALSRELTLAGCQVEILTSRFLYDRLEAPVGFHADERFFRLIGSTFADRLGFSRRPTARRVLKAAEYPIDWLMVLAQFVRRRPDVVHVQWSVDPRLDLLIWSALRSLGVPIVYTAHNLVPHRTRRSDASRYGRLYRAADALIVHSRRSAALLAERWGVRPDRIVVAPHGLLLETSPMIARDEARQTLGLPLDAEIVLFAGLIEPYKGLADLIAGFGGVAARRPAARLAIAGKPNEPFEPYRRQLAAAGLLNRTLLDLSFLPEQRLAAYLCAADVVVLPYRETTSSGLLFAARRFGRAVVATDVGDLGEVVLDGETGLLVPAHSPDRLGAAVERLLNDRALTDRIGLAGHRVSAGPEGWSEAGRRTVALYRRLLARS